MSVVWKLEYNGEVRPLAQWGLENAKLDLVNQMLDTLTLTVAREDDSDPEFEFEQKVILWRDNVRWFHGWITQLPFAESASDAKQEYVAAGPWYWLEKIVFKQPFWAVLDPNQPALGGAQIAVSKLVMFQSGSGAHSDAGEQAEEVVDYAIFKATQYNGGVPLFSRGSFADVAAEAPWETSRDLPCSEVLRRCMRWTRDAVAYWDYSGEIPELNVKRRATLTETILNLDEALRIAEYSLTPRQDLQPRGVVLTFEQAVTEIDGEGNDTGRQWTKFTEQRYPANIDDGPRVIAATLSLEGSGDGAEPIPNALAQTYYESLATLTWEGSMRLLEFDPTGIAMIGDRLNLTNGRTAWGTMNALIQRVSIDLANHETVVEFGPADQLGPQEFLDQIRFQKGSSSNGAGGSRNDGTPQEPQLPRDNPPSPPPSGPLDPNFQPPGQGHYMEICEGNVTKTIFVRS
jgi:hypothetical protein